MSTKLIGTACIVGILGFYGWLFTPDYVVTPNKEAPSTAYYSAERVFDKTETREFADETYTQTYTGACPDLAMQTSRALADKKLTISEVHYLREDARRLYNQAQHLSQLNDALRAAGKPVSSQPVPNCPHGDELF